MMVSQGPHFIDDLLTFTVTTHRFDTGALTDADAVPAYRVYEDETGTAILTGNMAKLDDAGTTGFYSEQLTLSAANGFEAGKSYNVYVTAAVNSVTGGQSGGFRVSGNLPAAVNTIANNAITAAAIATGAIDADAIADNAIDAGAIAADAVTEIQNGLSTLTAAGLLTTALADAYAANGAAPTLQQAIMAIHQYLMEKDITGTDYTVKKIDGDDAFVVTLNDATTPTASSRD